MNRISLLIGCKNNLEYTINFYNTTRAIYPDVEIVFVSYGSTDGTHDWLDLVSSHDHNLKVYHSDIAMTLSDTYNMAAKIATKEYVMHCHNDMVLGHGFLENISKYLAPKTSVSYTTIEPPIFGWHERPGKVVKDFGSNIESFDQRSFEIAVKEIQLARMGKTSEGWAAFSCMSRQEYLDMGGMDNLFNPMFCEDDDLLLRLKLAEYKLIVSLDAICYHFVSKSSRFDPEIKNKTQQFEINSNRNFIRKWRFRHSMYNKSVPLGIQFEWVNAPIENIITFIISELEPFADHIYYDSKISESIDIYLKSEQPNTKINLLDKFMPNIEPIKEDMYLTIKINNRFHEIMPLIVMIQDIITVNVPASGLYELNDLITLTVK